MRTMRTWVWTAGIVLALAGMTGCYPYAGFGGGGFSGFFAPIPVQPWVTERMEEKYCYKNDHRTPIMPPIRDGFPPPLCEDPPSEGEVLRAMPHVTRGVPYVYEEFRDQITIIPERIKDVIDPPRFYPLIGPAQLHHCHWKVTIYYYETVEVGYPFPFECKKQRVEVMYIDKDHLHLYANADQKKLQTFTRELSGY